MSWRQNAARPEGIGGRLYVNKMNSGAHAELSKWGLSHLTLTDYGDILEAGCGGGANVAALLAACPEAHVTGLDYSEVSVRKSRRVNAGAIRDGRCEIRCGDVSELPFADGSFDLATAFETIYFWPEIDRAFAQICRVLADGGRFFICNETDGDAPEGYRWEENIEGMKIYKESEVKEHLQRAGFAVREVDREAQRHWICFLAEKKGTNVNHNAINMVDN